MLQRYSFSHRQLLFFGFFGILGFFGIFSFVHAAVSSPQTLNDGLVGYWKFDETSLNSCSGGEDFCDVSGHENHGTGIGAAGANNTPQPSTTVADVQFSNARSMHMDGTDDYFSIPDNANYDGTTTLTLALWVRLGSEPSSWYPLVSKRGTAGVNNAYLLAFNTGTWGTCNSELNFEISSAGNNFQVNCIDKDAFTWEDTWHHIAVVYNTADAQDTSIYIDGIERSLLQSTNTNSALFNSSENLALGVGNQDSLSGYQETYYDDFRVYNRALSAGEISELANGYHPTQFWDGSAGESFFNAANWTGSTIPDPYSRIHIKNAPSALVLTGAIQVSGVIVGSGGSLDLNGTGVTMLESGSFTNYGTLRMIDTPSLTNITLDTTSTGTIMIYGTGTITSLPYDSYYNLILNDGLVGYWKLDETSGANSILDSSGYNHSGALLGDPSFNTSTKAPTSFQNGASFSIDGTGDYATVTDASALDLTSQGAISVWIRPTATQTDFAGIIAKSPQTDDIASDANYYIMINTNSDLRAGITNHNITTSTDYVQNVWQHLALTWNGSLVSFYKDGVLIGSTTQSSDAVPNNEVLEIGQRRATTGGNIEFQGQIDDVRIYDRTISPGEVAALAAGSQPSVALGSVTLDNALSIGGSLTLNGGTLDVSSSNYAITISGSFINQGGIFNAGQGTVTFEGTDAGLKILSGGQRFHNITISAAGSWTLKDNLTATGTLAISAGTLDLSSDNRTIKTGVLNHSAGTITAQSGTIILTSQSNTTLTTQSTLSTLRVEDPTENGLIAYWKLDEGTNTGKIIDSSANGNAGVRYGTTGLVWTGAIASGLSNLQFSNPYVMNFDGANDYVDIGKSILPTDGSAWSVAFWTNYIADTDNEYPLGQYKNNGAAGRTVWYTYAATNDYRFWHGAIGENTFGPYDNGWVHLGTTFDGTTVRLYYNGEFVTSDTGLVNIVAEDFLIGAGIDSDNSIFRFFEGQLDDIRVYNRALSGREIKNLYNGHYASGDSGTATVTLGQNTVTRNLYIDSGNLNMSSFDLTASVNLELHSGNGSLTVGSNSLTVGNLTISGASLDVSSATVDIDGDTEFLSGALIAPSGTMTLAGDVRIEDIFTFTHSSGTFQLDGTSQAFTGTILLHNFTKTVSSAAALTFGSGSSLSVSGALILRGAVGNVLSLRTSPEANEHFLRLDSAGTQTLDYLNVKDSNASGGQELDCDAANDGCVNSGNNTNWNFDAPDVTAPTIQTLFPENGDKDAYIETNLVITFNEVIGKTGTGTVSIYKSSDDSLVEQINVTSSLVTGSGTVQITIDPTSTLDTSTVYYVQISSNAFPDSEGNFFAGISDKTTWSFTTASNSSSSSSSASSAPSGSATPLCSEIHWKFDEVSGADAIDSTASLHTGSLLNSPVRSTSEKPTLNGGNVGSLYFDGNSDGSIMEVARSSFPFPSSGFTLAAWVYYDDTDWANMGNIGSGCAGFGSWTTIFERGDDQPYLGVTDAGKLTLYPSTVSSADVPLQEWVHVAFTWDETTGKLFINGSQDGSTTSTPPRSGGSGTSLGVGYNTCDTPWKGYIDDMRVYARGLSSAEVAALADGNDIAFVNEPNACNADVPPTMQSLSPADNATNVAVDSNLVITFSETVTAGAGDVLLKKSSDDSTVETIAASAVSGLGTATITINPSSDLDTDTQYYVQIEDNAFQDSGANFFAGISDSTTWSFISADTVAPTVQTLSPADNAIDVATSTNLVITFNETIGKTGTGTVSIYRSGDDSLVETISVAGSLVTGSGSTQITINPATTLSGSTAYYVQISANAFPDSAGNFYAGISNTTSWNFTTGDESAPAVQTLSPADNATDVATSTNLVITFNETIASTGTGTVSIYTSSDDGLVETIAVTGSLVTGSGSTEITINPSTTLSSATAYYVQISSNAFPDSAGNFFAGISNATTWNFTTADEVAPTVSTFAPADGATGVAVAANLVITFNETIGSTGTGTVSIYKSSDDSLVETIAVTGSLVTGSGSTEITINPTNNLANGTSYYVQISSNAFSDTSGNFYTGISDKTTWNFTTVSTAASSSSSEETQEEASGTGGGGGGRRYSVEQMTRDEIAKAYKFIIARYEGTVNQFIAEQSSSSSSRDSERQRLLTLREEQFLREEEERERTLLLAAKRREDRIAARIAEHEAELLALEEQKLALQSQLTKRREQRLAIADALADKEEKSLEDLIASVNDRLKEREEEIAEQKRLLVEEEEANIKEREERLALLEQKELEEQRRLLSEEQEREHLFREAEKAREDRIAQRIAEHREELLALEEEKRLLQEKIARQNKKELQDLLTAVEQRLLERQNSLVEEQRLLVEEQEMNRKAREQRLAQIEQQHGAAVSDSSESFGSSSSQNLERIGALRDRLVATIEEREVLFSDVVTTEWYAPFVATLISNGVAQGYRDASGNLTGEFGVQKSITRAEMLKMALEAAGTELAGGTPRNTSAKGTWASLYIATAESLQLSVFSPGIDVHAPATRGEVVQTLLEAMSVPIANQVTSYSDVPPDHPYRSAIATASFFGIVSGDTLSDGTPKGTFRPNAPMNRAEVAKIISVVREVLQ